MTLLGSRRATYRADAAPAQAAEPAAPEPESAVADAARPTVPQQRQRRDAYTLYAEIYALRLDLDDPGKADDH